jgi:hypothetical protein
MPLAIFNFIDCFKPAFCLPLFAIPSSSSFCKRESRLARTAPSTSTLVVSHLVHVSFVCYIPDSLSLSSARYFWNSRPTLSLSLSLSLSFFSFPLFKRVRFTFAFLRSLFLPVSRSTFDAFFITFTFCQLSKHFWRQFPDVHSLKLVSQSTRIQFASSCTPSSY